MQFTSAIATSLTMALAVIAAPAIETANIVAASGQASYYNPSVGTGSCGQVHQDSEMVAALPLWQQGTPPIHCGKTAHVKNVKTGQTIDVKVVDSCRACGGPGYERVIIDLSEGAFKALNGGSTTAGRIEVVVTGI